MSCNQFLLNNIAWAGSGDFKNQGTSSHIRNQFSDNTSWDIIYDVNGAEWEYFYSNLLTPPSNEIPNSTIGLTKTSTLFNNSSISTAIDGVDITVGTGTPITCNPLFTKRSLSIAQLDEASVAIYPNPFNNEITVESSTIVDGTILVHDIVGKLIATVPLEGNTTLMQLNGLTKGLYIVEVRDSKSNRVLTTKILKQ